MLQKEKELYNFIQEKAPDDLRERLAPFSKSLYRLHFLNSQSSQLNECERSHFPNALNLMKFLVSESLRACGVEDPVPTVTPARKDNDFDYQCSDAMKIQKTLNKMRGENLSPKEVAEKIIKNIPENDIVDKMEVSNPAFINIRLKNSYIFDICKNLILAPSVPPPMVKKRKVVVDFSSPNIAKEMHVGHLRSTIIGESICRIFEFVGFDVVRVSHLGDWGTQFGMLIAYLEEKYPNFNEEPPAIQDLQKFYKESKIRFDSDEDFKHKAHLKVVELQNGANSKVTAAWKAICEISRRDFQKIYKRLGVKVEEKGESFYQSRMQSVVDELVARGVVEIDGICKIIRVPGVKVPLILVKSDGGFTYDTSDIATIKYRMTEDKADWIIYVVDIGQREHFDTLFKFARMVNWFNPDVHRIEHIGFGIVLGEGKKRLKTRSGDSVKLSELLDESVSRSKAKLIERGMADQFTDEQLNVIAESLGYSCVKYADLSHNLVSDYEFSFDRMLDDRGNTGVYLLYTYTRVRSILRKANVTEADIVNHVRNNSFIIEHNHEMILLRKLIHFPEVIFRIVFDTYPHYLCEYLYDLCCIMSEFYDSCQIINVGNNTVNMNRLSQIYAASLILKKGFDLLGFQALEKM